MAGSYQFMAQLVLVGKDWKTRALLRAQLLEEGVDVEAYESTEDGLQTLVASPPALVLVDLTASNDPNADIDHLAKWVMRVPTWIIASRSLAAIGKIETLGAERVLYRPLDVGELVKEIRRRVFPAAR